MVGFGISTGVACAVVSIAGMFSPHHIPTEVTAGPVAPRVAIALSGAPAGTSVDAVLTFDIEAPWHIYYDGENDSGQPPTIKGSGLPEGIKLGPIRWATPTRHLLDGGILDSTYERRVELPFTFEIAASVLPGEHSGTLGVTWMECAEVCRVAEATLNWSLSVLPEGRKPETTADAKVISAAVKTLPAVWTPELAAKLKDTLRISVEITPETGRLKVWAGKARGVEYHARAGSVRLIDAVEDGASETSSLDAPLSIGEKERSDPKAAVTGIVVVVNEKGVREGYEVNFPITKKPDNKLQDKAKEIPRDSPEPKGGHK